MRFFWFWLASLGMAVAADFDGFISGARARHGEFGERAARFLVEHMPAQDQETLSPEFLAENLDLALKAREEFPWAKSVPEDLFLNDVLPYAVFDEPRDPWRADFLQRARVIVQDASSASEAAMALNRRLFNEVKVHYHTGRKRPNQSPKESMESGRATCTGLSIILVDACRAVGIPARAVGTPMWSNGRGNHTWVEIWDRDWHFAGADEPDPAGLNRGWFVGDASEAKADVPRNVLYATSWKRDGLAFPMVWARGSSNVAAVNVTARYAKAKEPAAEVARLGVRLWDRTGGERLPAKVCVLDGVRRTCAFDSTRAGQADLNDMPRFKLAPGSTGWLRFTRGDEVREMAFGPLAPGDPTVDAVWAILTPVPGGIAALEAWLAQPPEERRLDDPLLGRPLDRAEADRALELLAADRRAQLARDRVDEVEKKAITLGDRTLRWMSRTFGEAPAGGRSLWISMHGGGGAPPAVNDRQWTNQVRLYEPPEGVYVAPRAPTDTWNLWHEGHIDPLFQRLIDDHVAVLGVNPDRVYLMGYSAGGDGVWQLAPRMADRFAAAAMMAGHPNEASMLGLRNLPFALFMGANDAAYSRNRIAAERAAELNRLAVGDPGGYVHLARIYPGLGHWMNRQDAEAVPWMARFHRDSWPARVVWEQDDVVHRRFYWLGVPEGVAIRDRQRLVATLRDRTITLEGEVNFPVELRLSDRLLDLDRPLVVKVGQREAYSGRVTRRAREMAASLEERLDPASAASALLRVQ